MYLVCKQAHWGTLGPGTQCRADEQGKRWVTDEPASRLHAFIHTCIHTGTYTHTDMKEPPIHPQKPSSVHLHN